MSDCSSDDEDVSSVQGDDLGEVRSDVVAGSDDDFGCCQRLLSRFIKLAKAIFGCCGSLFSRCYRCFDGSHPYGRMNDGEYSSPGSPTFSPDDNVLPMYSPPELGDNDGVVVSGVLQFSS